MTWQERWLRRYYGPDRGWVDGTTEFFRLCESAIDRGKPILEVGAGPSNRTSRFLATLGPLHGVDPDPDVRGNDALATAAVIHGDRYPFEDGFFSACVSSYVIEHVTDPEAHLREIHRVLQPGGAYVFRTPNLWHYVALVSRFTPQWFHELVANRLRNHPPDAHPPYPTVYRMSSRRAVERMAAQAGFTVETMRLVEKEPSYGMSSRALFLAFMAYERAVNATELAAPLRANLFVVLRKR